MKSNEENESRVHCIQKIKSNVWIFVKYFIAVLNTIAATASIIGLAISIFSKDNISTAFFVSVGIIIIAVLFTIIAVIKSSKNDKMKELNKYAEGFHDILHLTRDCYGELMETVSDGTYVHPAAFRKYMTEHMMKIMDLLSRNLTEGTGCKVRACIKTFDFIKDKETNKSKMNLITLARSGVLNVNNMIDEHYKKIPLEENTDFNYIFGIKEGYAEERKHFFIAHDLIKYSQEKEYENSNKKWKKLYRTTIVMPIRYLVIPDGDEGEGEPEYDIIGYLCIDSKKKNLFSIEQRGFVLDYLKGVADILYVYLNECIIYHDYLKVGIKNDYKTT